jgi:uncharacterized protein YjcR
MSNATKKTYLAYLLNLSPNQIKVWANREGRTFEVQISIPTDAYYCHTFAYAESVTQAKGNALDKAIEKAIKSNPERS